MTNYKVGAEVVPVAVRNGEVMIIEQVCSRGKVPHYLCSYRDAPWAPLFWRHEFIKPITSNTKGSPNV